MTRAQKWAKTAYECISEVDEKDQKEYKSFALAFPAHLHDWGLCQAISFAEAKGKTAYLGHLKKILNNSPLETKVREASLAEYQQLTRDTMGAAIWLKRYTEAIIKAK